VGTSHPVVGKVQSQSFAYNAIDLCQGNLSTSSEKQTCCRRGHSHDFVLPGSSQSVILRVGINRHAGPRPVIGLGDKHEPTQGLAQTGKMYGFPTVPLRPSLTSLRRPGERVIVRLASLQALPLARENIP
jgi:hypothetical protein